MRGRGGSKINRTKNREMNENISKKEVNSLSKDLGLPVTDIIRWNNAKFIDHIEKSIFK